VVGEGRCATGNDFWCWEDEERRGQRARARVGHGGAAVCPPALSGESDHTLLVADA
jgi:hypothetical protein